MNNMGWQTWVGGALAGALCAAALPAAQESFEDTRAIVEFQRAADSYALLHRRVERKVPRADEMSAALQASRPDAHQGAFFTPAIQVAFGNRIARALRSSGCGAALSNAAGQGGRVTPRVNEGLPANGDDATWSCVTNVLPHLPDELQYVVFGRDLLLADRHVRIVVDVFVGALGPPGSM